MKHLLLILSILLFSQFSEARKPISKKLHKLSYDEFMYAYGTDDTSIAIINIYFDKRDYSATGQMSFLPISTIVAIVIPPIGVGLMVISSPLFINGLLTSNKYSRKKLLKILNNYKDGDILSNRNKKKIVQEIKAQQEIYYEDLLEARYNSIR